MPEAKLASLAMRLGGLMAWSGGPRQRAFADLPTWPVIIEAHAVAVLVLGARPQPSTDAHAFATISFDGIAFLIPRNPIFDSTICQF